MQKLVFNDLSRQKQYKYPCFFLGLFLTFLLATVCLAGRITGVGSMIVPGGIFIFPLTFCICDIVGEAYGYAYPRMFIWIGVLAEFLFSVITITVSHMTAAESFQHATAYQIVFDPTIRYVGSALIGLIIGEFTNIYLLAKWKISLKGRLFAVRSLASTAVGQGLLTIIVDSLNYSGKLSASELVRLMYCGYSWKMCSAFIMVIPAWLVVRWLKRVEKVDHYDVNTNFNPFIFSLESSSKDTDQLIPSEQATNLDKASN